MSKTDATPAADRGSECNDQLGLAPERDDVAWLHENKASLEYQERRYKWAGPPHWRLSWGDYCIVRLTPQACISEARAIQALKA
jgi:hypothetical protein